MILSKIQSELKAPKNQFNKFGNYSYRSCEDIVESVKPILNKYNIALIMSDEVVEVGSRIYVKATVKLLDENKEVIATASAYAREEETKKGMAEAQITGSSSSYARKYALNGLFAIDDNKDDDYTNTHGKESKKSSNTNNVKATQKQIEEIEQLAFLKGSDIENIKSAYKVKELSEMTVQQASDCIKKLNLKKDVMEVRE